MKSFKIIIKTILTSAIIFSILTLIITILNYFNILNYKIINIIKLLIPLISMFIGGYKIGNNSEKKGWLEGIKFSLITSILFLIITIILKKLKLEYLIYLIIITTSTTLGSIIGINKKTKK